MEPTQLCCSKHPGIKAGTGTPRDQRCCCRVPLPAGIPAKDMRHLASQKLFNNRSPNRFMSCPTSSCCPCRAPHPFVPTTCPPLPPFHHPLPPTPSPLVQKVRLVSHQEDYDVAAALSAHLLDPTHRVEERRAICRDGIKEVVGVA